MVSFEWMFTYLIVLDGLCGGLGLCFGLFADDVKNTVFQSFLVLAEAVLLPSVIEYARVKVVSLHALLKEANTGTVVGLLLESQRTAVLHELFELAWVAIAEIVQRGFNFLFLNVIVLFVLASTR